MKISKLFFACATAIAASLAACAFAATDYEAHANAVATMDTNAKALAAKRESAEIERQKTLQALAARLESKDALILGIVESLGARIAAGAQAQAPQPTQIAAPPQPLPECGFGCYLGKGIAGAFGFVRDVAPTVATVWTSKINAGVQTATAMFSRDIQLGAQQSNVALFQAGYGAATNIATAGYGANTSIAAAALAHPTTVINNSGDQAAIVVGGGTAAVTPTTTTTTNTTTNAVTCPAGNGGNATGAVGGSPSCTANGK